MHHCFRRLSGKKRLAVVLSLVRFGRPRRERHSSLICGPRAASTPLSHPVVLLPVQASPAAVAVAAHRSTTTPRSSWGGGDGDLDHAGVRPAAERRRRTAPGSRGRRLRPTSELPADSPAACTFASTLSTSARCASDVGVALLAGSVSTAVPAGALEGVTCRCGCGRWWRCGRSRAAVPCARRSQNPMTALVCDVDFGHGFWTRLATWRRGSGGCRRNVFRTRGQP
jgi:hypothetical protein